MKIGNLEFNEYAALAPMAGVADRAMREMCMNYGASYCIGELTSAKGVSMNDKKSETLLYVSDAERPMGVQIFGCDPDTMAQAAVMSLKNKPDFIDINMGCPAPKVAKNGAGSALMKDPKLAANIVRAVKDAVDIPVTVKMRSGWDSNNKNAVELALMCEDAGADAITVHGRTREQMYRPPADLDIIRDVKRAVNVPVIGNGDIFDANDAAQMLEYTQCDYVMVGRGACGAPWIFMQINAYLSETRVVHTPPVSHRMLALIKQVELMIKYKGEYIGIRESRKHASYYMKGLKGAATYRRECATLESLEQLHELCFRICKENE